MSTTRIRNSSPLTPPDVTCPQCGTGALAVSPASGSGPATCGTCGHRAAAGLVAEAAFLLGEQSKLLARLTWVNERIAAGDLTTPTPFSAPAVGTAGPGRPGTPATPARGSTPVPLQTVLLGIGALLLVVAAVVFAAVAWDRLGATGQLGLLTVVVGSLSAAAHGLRRSFRATAETLAAVAAAVAAVALVAAPRLGLGADWMQQDNALWITIALLTIAVLATGLGAVSRLVAWRVAVVVALAGAAVAGTIALAGEKVGEPAPLGIAAVAAISAVLLGLSPTGGRRHLDPDARLPQARPIGIALALTSAGLGLTALDNSRHDHLWTLTWAVVAVAAFVAATRLPSMLTAVLAGIAAGFVPVLAVAGFDPGAQRTDDGVLAPALLGLAVLGGLSLAAAHVDRAVGPHGTTGLAGVAVRPVLLAFTGAVWLLATPQLDDHGWIWPTWGVRYLVIVAAALLAVALWRRITWTAWCFAAPAALALVVYGIDHGWDHQPESFSLPLAGILLVAGVVAAYWTLGPDAPRDTLVTFGPALATALLPSAITALGEAVSGQGAQRSVIVIAAGAALVLVGLFGRLRGPFTVGTVGLLVAALGQLYALSELVPRWVVLALAGCALVAAGFSLEALGRAGRHAWQRTRALR